MLAMSPRVGHGLAVPWGEFAARAPELAAFGAQRLAAVPAYLATVDDAGAPRVHPVTPIIDPDGSSCSWSRPRPRATTSLPAACTRCMASYQTTAAREASSTSAAVGNGSTRRMFGRSH
jgi:hypothetical protein